VTREEKVFFTGRCSFFPGFGATESNEHVVRIFDHRFAMGEVPGERIVIVRVREDDDLWFREINPQNLFGD